VHELAGEAATATATAADGQACAAAAAAAIQEATNEAIKEVGDMLNDYNYCATVPAEFAKEFETRLKRMATTMMANVVDMVTSQLSDESGEARALADDCNAANENRANRHSASSRCHSGVGRGSHATSSS